MSDKIKETCVCGSVHEGDSYSVKYWRNEHTAEHAERVIAIQKVSPYIPPILEPYRFTFEDQYGWPAYNPVTCGMSPFQREDFDKRQESASSEAVQNKIMYLSHKVEDYKKDVWTEDEYAKHIKTLFNSVFGIEDRIGG